MAKTPIPSHQVHVERDRAVIHTVSITVPMMNRRDDGLGADDELVIMLNGRVVKRLSMWQAERAGLVDARPEEFV